MSAAAPAFVSFRLRVLPWAGSPHDEARFYRILRMVLMACVFLCLLLLLLPRPKEDRAAPLELPPRLAKLIIEREPPRPKPVVKPETPPPPPPPLAKAPPVPEARKPVPDKPPGEVLGEARRKAAGVGLLAMKDTLAEMRGAPLAVQLNQDIKPVTAAGAGVGTGVGVGVGAGKDPGLGDRAMITSNATKGSGGINTASYSRDTGGGGLAGRATTLVAGVAGGGGGGGLGSGSGKGDGLGTGAANAGGKLTRSGSGKASRSIEDIKLVFERNKGSIYAIYNRALREEPSLEGKVVLELTIARTGEVIDVRVISSELKAPELERKLIARIRQFDFGAKDVDQIVVSWPVDFLPS